MTEVFDLNRRINAQRERYFLNTSVVAMNDEPHVLARRDLTVESADVEDFRAVEFERHRRRVTFELQRQHAHPDEVRAVYALEAARDDGAHA